MPAVNTHRILLAAIAVDYGVAGAAGAIVAPILALGSGMGHAMLSLVLMVIVL